MHILPRSAPELRIHKPLRSQPSERQQRRGEFRVEVQEL